MSEYFATLLFWHWWILALVLIIIEMMAPGFFLMWIGGAAAVTGLVTMIVPSLPWEAQFVLFGVLAIASVVGARYYFKRNPIETTDSTLNKRGAQYIGRTFSLEEAIVNGTGKVRVGDSVWRAFGPDLPVGDRVKVIGVEGAALKVEKA